MGFGICEKNVNLLDSQVAGFLNRYFVKIERGV